MVFGPYGGVACGCDISAEAQKCAAVLSCKVPHQDPVEHCNVCTTKIGCLRFFQQGWVCVLRTVLFKLYLSNCIATRQSQGKCLLTIQYATLFCKAGGRERKCNQTYAVDQYWVREVPQLWKKKFVWEQQTGTVHVDFTVLRQIWKGPNETETPETETPELAMCMGISCTCQGTPLPTPSCQVPLPRTAFQCRTRTARHSPTSDHIARTTDFTTLCCTYIYTMFLCS